MKAVKVVFKLLVLVVVLALAAVLALPLWFGPVAKTVANSAVPGVVKADFRLGYLSLNPYTARFELGDLNLGNPRGYSVKDAVRVGGIVFDADTLSLMTDVIHVEEVTIRDLFVSVVTGGENGVLNFKQIQYNVAGGKEKYEAAQKKGEGAKGATEPPTEIAEEKKPEKKIIIDRLEVSGLTLQLSILPVRIPSIVLKDIGRKTGGTTLEEAWQQILDGVMKSAGVAGDQFKALTALSGNAVNQANEAVSKTAAQATAAVDGVTRQFSAAPAKVTEAVSSTTSAASGVVDGSAKTVGDGAKAVGDGAKKALDSLKSLW